MRRRFVPQATVLVVLFIFLVYGFNYPAAEYSYIEFLTHKLVLSVGVAFVGICAGSLVKDFLLVIYSATFVLAIYCLAFVFDAKTLFPSFFFAIYTVFLGFAALASLVKNFQCWLLSND